MKKEFRTEGISSLTPVETKTTYALISDAGKLLDDRVAKATEQYKLQSGARRVLSFLAVRDGVSQLDLIRVTHLKAPTISVALQKLEKDGYVFRRPDEYDLRATRVFLTEKGRALDDKIRRHICLRESKRWKINADEPSGRGEGIHRIR